VQAREEKEAWRAFKEPIQRVIGCVDQTARLHEKAFPDGVRLLATTVDGIPFGDGLVFRFSLQLEPILVDDVWRMRHTPLRLHDLDEDESANDGVWMALAPSEQTIQGCLSSPSRPLGLESQVETYSNGTHFA
jgi:hypothetical protein